MKNQKEMTKTDMYDFLLENDIATTNEINLVTHINGYNKQALIDIIEVRTGYNFDQYIEYEIIPYSFAQRKEFYNY